MAWDEVKIRLPWREIKAERIKLRSSWHEIKALRIKVMPSWLDLMTGQIRIRTRLKPSSCEAALAVKIACPLAVKIACHSGVTDCQSHDTYFSRRVATTCCGHSWRQNKANIWDAHDHDMTSPVQSRTAVTYRNQGHPCNSNDSHRDAHEPQMKRPLHKLFPGNCDPQEDRYSIGDVEANGRNGNHGWECYIGFEHRQAQQECKCDHEPDCIDWHSDPGVHVGPDAREGQAMVSCKGPAHPASSKQALSMICHWPIWLGIWEKKSKEKTMPLASIQWEAKCDWAFALTVTVLPCTIKADSCCLKERQTVRH